MKILFFVAGFCTLLFGAVEEEEPRATIQREPAIEKLTPEEERLVPFIDENGILNGFVSEKIVLPSPDLASDAK